MSKTEIISPVSIDLGAKNTGVFFAHYAARAPLSAFAPRAPMPDGDAANNGAMPQTPQTKGVVYQLAQNNYTLLMVNRTAARHAMRGHDRCQMAKRLFRLVWKNELGLEWTPAVAQAVGFLMNRRGFFHLTGQYDADKLETFPKEVYDQFPDKLKTIVAKFAEPESAVIDMATVLQELAQKHSADKGEGGMSDLAEASHIMRLHTLRVQTILKNLHLACQAFSETQKHLGSLEKVGKADFDCLAREIATLKKAENGRYENGSNSYSYKNAKEEYDLRAFVRHEGKRSKQIIAELQTAAEALLRSCGNKDSDIPKYWEFKPEQFFKTDGKKQEEFDEHHQNPEYKGYKKLHLHHLAFALHSTLNEMQTGGRYRSGYFTEIVDELNAAKARVDNSKRKNGAKASSCINKKDSGKIGIKPAMERLYTAIAEGENAGKIRSADEIVNLLGHISNLEIKPLRKFFNNEKHKGGDKWDKKLAKKLTDVFENWICNEWRIDEKKEKQKYDYYHQKFLPAWREFCRSTAAEKRAVEFWRQNPPEWTIPPYQNNNNRRPPKCQSLVFNVAHLDAAYNKDGDGWRKWLDTLKNSDEVRDYLVVGMDDDEKARAYGDCLKNLKSGKDRPYFPDKPEQGERTQDDLRARELQFILDRAKATDPLNLNEIFSHAKKLRQRSPGWQNHEEKLQKAIASSKLPAHLKESGILPNSLKDGIFDSGGFLHLVYEYYKQRQRARDGRIFIHPEYPRNPKSGREYAQTGRYDSAGHLLTYCNHKPRHKRHQTFSDAARTLRVPQEKLKKEAGAAVEKAQKAAQTAAEGANKVRAISEAKKAEENPIAYWMRGIVGDRKTNDAPGIGVFAAAAKLQKKVRGPLKLAVAEVNNWRAENPNAKWEDCDSTILKRIESDKKKRGELAKDVYETCKTANQAWPLLVCKFYSDEQMQKERQRLEKNPAAALFDADNLHNVVFEERSGNAKTCAVCSADNAYRMQRTEADNKASDEKDGAEGNSKAQPMPAIKMRMFDGAVMRMARIVGKAIADNKWKTIQPALEKGHKVRVPIITERNRFEFEPSREELVKQQRGDKKRKGAAAPRDYALGEDKEERIKKACKYICPYTGQKMENDPQGEMDHIIPRKSQWGTINDEANLVWASHDGNQHKTNNPITLEGLNQRYLAAQFPDMSVEEIKREIRKIDAPEGFSFGQYKSFLNLSPENQKCFRHALFLGQDDSLFKKVANAISNRNRAQVNGTQRYFAQVVADELHKLAKKAGKAQHLCFDYFDVDAAEISMIRRKLQQNSAVSADGKPQPVLSDKVHGDIKTHEKPKAKEKTREELLAENKDPDKKQKPKPPEPQSWQSHLIDAEIAFLCAVSRHYCRINPDKSGDHGRGSLGILAHDGLSPLGYTTDDGEVKSPFELVHVMGAAREPDTLQRQIPGYKESPTDKVYRPLFNEQPIAMHFLKLITVTVEGEEMQFVGFCDLSLLKECLAKDNWQDVLGADYVKTNKYARLPKGEEAARYEIGDGDYQFGKKRIALLENCRLNGRVVSVHVTSLNHAKVSEFLISEFNTASDAADWNSNKEDQMKILDQLSALWYFTKNQNVITGESGKEGLYSFTANHYTFTDPDKVKLINPGLKKAWENLGESVKNSDNLKQDVKNYFMDQSAQKQEAADKLPHQKTRRVFSLPISASAAFLVRRKTVKGIYQADVRPATEADEKRLKRESHVYQAMSATSKFGSRTLLHIVGDEQDERLVNAYRKPNIFYFLSSEESKDFSANLKKKLRAVSRKTAINPNCRYGVDIADVLPREFRQYVRKIECRRTDDSRPFYRFYLSDDKMELATFVEFLRHFPFRHAKVNKSHLDEICTYLSGNTDGQLIQTVEMSGELSNASAAALQIIKERWSAYCGEASYVEWRVPGKEFKGTPPSETPRH